ncbi:hypothetical protein AgCh_018569 [Apium graveolens]
MEGYNLRLWGDFIRNKPRGVLDITSGKLGAERSRKREHNKVFSINVSGARSAWLGGRSESWAPAQDCWAAAQGRYNLRLWGDFIRNKPRGVLGIASGKLGAERSRKQEQNKVYSSKVLGARSGLLGGRSGLQGGRSGATKPGSKGYQAQSMDQDPPLPEQSSGETGPRANLRPVSSPSQDPTQDLDHLLPPAYQVPAHDLDHQPTWIRPRTRITLRGFQRAHAHSAIFQGRDARNVIELNQYKYTNVPVAEEHMANLTSHELAEAIRLNRDEQAWAQIEYEQDDEQEESGDSQQSRRSVFNRIGAKAKKNQNEPSRKET